MTSTPLQVPHQSGNNATVAVSDFGDVRAEFQALLSGCGIYDLSWRSKFAVTGEDRVRWMNGMVTNNIRDLNPGHAVYAFLLNAQGRIQGDLYVFRREDTLLVDTEQAQRDKILQLFDRFIIADDVEVADVTDATSAIGLTGPDSRSVLERAGFALPDLAHLQFAGLTWHEHTVTLLRSGEEARESWQGWIAPEHMADLMGALGTAGARPVGTTALNLFRISRGIPQFGVDIRDRDLPQETAQTRALNFTKGCYLGQEIVERIRSRGAVHRLFGAFTVDGPLPEPGTKILATDPDNKAENEKEVGEITSSAILPFPNADRPVALGYLRREAAAKGLRAGTAKIRTASIPFY